MTVQPRRRAPGHQPRGGVTTITSSVMRPDVLVPVALALLAAIVYLTTLAASSYFVDEATTINIVAGSVKHAMEYVRSYETSPPTYFLAFWVWAHATGTHGEFVSRLPSALAGVALVVAVWYLARLLFGRRAALIAGLLAVASPLLLQYAQQARTYAFLVLFATLTAIAALHASRTHSGRWLAIWCAGAVVTVSLHYVGWLVVAPMAVWLLRDGWVPGRARRLVLIVLVAVGVLWASVAVAQFTRFPNGGLGAEAAGLTVGHALQVIAAPFFGRTSADASVAEVLGALAVLLAVGRLVSTTALGARHERGLLVALALTPVIVLVLFGAAGRDLVITRYATVAAPFLIVTMAGAAASVRKPVPRAAIAGGIVVLALAGTARSLQPANFYPDGRSLAEDVAESWHPTDAVVLNALGSPDNLLTPVAYYARQNLRPGYLTVLAPPWSAPVFGRLRAAGRRLWVVSETGRHAARDAPVPPGYRVAESHAYRGLQGLRLLLAVPTTAGHAALSSGATQ